MTLGTNKDGHVSAQKSVRTKQLLPCFGVSDMNMTPPNRSMSPERGDGLS